MNPAHGAGGYAVQIFYACITAPIVEEVLFRGFAISYNLFAYVVLPLLQ